MGKKKVKVKFIDKKKAISFHLVAKADQGDLDSDGYDSEQAELERELREQRREERRAAGLPDEEEEENAGSSSSAAAASTSDGRIDLLDMAAEAEGIETRAQRQARKAAKETSKQKFFLQQNIRPGQQASLPKDFPTEYLYDGTVEQEEEYWEREEQRKWELERQAEAPALLPHNYDYSKHLRPITGRGVFLEAKRGDGAGGVDPRSTSVATSSSSSSSTAVDELDASVDRKLVARVERLQRQLARAGRRVRIQKDFVEALEGEANEEELEELQDDFVIEAMGGKEDSAEEEDEDVDDEDERKSTDGERSAGKEEEEDAVLDDEMYEDMEYDDEQDEDGDDIPGLVRARPTSKRRPHNDDDDDDDDEYDDDDEDEEEEDEAGTGELDAAFNKLLREEYDDDEIGELDHYADENPSALEGELDLEEVDGEINDFLAHKEKTLLEGGTIIDRPDEKLQKITLKKLELVADNEKDVKEVEEEIEAMLEPAPREQWDAESILSTYSNTENHPHILGVGGSRRRKKGGRSRLNSDASSAASSMASIPASLLSTAAASAFAAAPLDGVEEDSEEDEYDDAGRDVDPRENRGRARPEAESLDEKKARKQAVKQAKREAKERKKQLKTLYSKENAAAAAKQVKINQTNPRNVKKI